MDVRGRGGHLDDGDARVPHREPADVRPMEGGRRRKVGVETQQPRGRGSGGLLLQARRGILRARAVDRSAERLDPVEHDASERHRFEREPLDEERRLPQGVSLRCRDHEEGRLVVQKGMVWSARSRKPPNIVSSAATNVWASLRRSPPNSFVITPIVSDIPAEKALR